MKPVFSDVQIDKFDQMRKLYTDDNDDFEGSDFTKYALYDFDEDGIPNIGFRRKTKNIKRFIL